VCDDLNKLVNCRLIMHSGGETRGVQQIDDRPPLQLLPILHWLFQCDDSFGESLSG
jgi:hypothetical protein